MSDKKIQITPAMHKALCARLVPNFHKTWNEYASSQFRKDWLAMWAGDDSEKQRVAEDLIESTTGKK